MSDIQSLNEMRNILGMDGHHSHASENKENEAMNNQDEKSTIESDNAKGNNNKTRNKNGAERSLATGSKNQEMFETINETSFVIKVPNFDTKPIRRSPSTTASIVTISSSDDESLDDLDASNASLGNKVDI